MIVREADGQLQFITQPDHAQLARRVMEHCVPLSKRPRRDAIVRAIGEHDNGWAEADADPIVDPVDGTVVDFVRTPLSVLHGVWHRGIARLADDAWVAALVAQHAVSIYERRRSIPQWAAFFVELEETRDRFAGAAGLPHDELLSDYAYVRLGDLISLAFCLGELEGYEPVGWSVQPIGARVVVTPDVFGGATFPIDIAAKQISNRSFRSDADLRGALSEAGTVTLRGEVTGSWQP